MTISGGDLSTFLDWDRHPISVILLVVAALSIIVPRAIGFFRRRVTEEA
jgi:TctA family transporter